MRVRFLIILGLLSVAVSCAHSRSAINGRAPVQSAEPIAEAAYPAEARRYMQMALTDPERLELRDRLIATILTDAQGLVDIGDYEGVVGQLGRVSDLLSPADYSSGVLPTDFEPIAKFMADKGGQIGDEGRVLAANLLLARLTEDEIYERRYNAIASWGRESRSTMENVLRRYGGLIEVWSEHADLTPAPEVLDILAGLHIARRDAVTAESAEFRSKFGIATNRIWRLAPLDVAAVYLAHGDVSSAITHVEAMGPGGELQLRLLDLLRMAKSPGESGAEATFELIEGFRVARPDVASGLCQAALRAYPKDYRFPTCMARVASDKGRYADAAAWYVIAIEIEPGLIELYDEALGQLDEFIESRLMDPHPERSSALARGAEQILSSRQERWPDSEPPIAADQLELLIGMLEMNAGRAAEAQKRFEASIDAGESAAALMQLGVLLERTGKPRAAESRYRRALALTPDNTRADALRRAEVLEHLGNAAQAQGKTKETVARYRSALNAWTKERDQLEGPTAALVEIRRGVLLDHLDRHDEAVEAFQSAMAHAPQWREVYASILSHMVASVPDFEFASNVWRRAQLQLNLPPEWKVYFTLWIQFIGARADQPRSPEHTDLLRRLGRSSSWWGKLARFGAQDIDYAQLMTVVSSLGEETEALFYQGARLFAGGDSKGASEQFQLVLDTKMVSFYEYEMARRFLLEQSKARTNRQ